MSSFICAPSGIVLGAMRVGGRERTIRKRKFLVVYIIPFFAATLLHAIDVAVFLDFKNFFCCCSSCAFFPAQEGGRAWNALLTLSLSLSLSLSLTHTHRNIHQAQMRLLRKDMRNSFEPLPTHTRARAHAAESSLARSLTLCVCVET